MTPHSSPIVQPLFLDALKCRNSSNRPPVWLMRQAGRYLPEYRALRQKYSFLEMCHQPDLITEVTLMPIKRFGMDAAILFADILLISEAMGVGLHFDDGIGPVIDRPVRSAADLVNLPPPSHADALHFVAEGIRHVKPQLNVPLIGFCGAPFTVASYMIEGKSSRDLKKTKQWMLQDPDSFHRLLTLIADWSVVYLQMQIEAGIDAIQIFDSWANMLAHQQFKEFSLHYMQYILDRIPNVPIILFCRGSSTFASQLAEIKPAGISLDWNCDITQMRRVIPLNIALQGNLDPDILEAPLPVIKKEVQRILRGMKGDPGFIFNLGHGVFPSVPLEAVQTLVDCVKGS
jgi:uroporphyrinogen decarboxylase